MRVLIVGAGIAGLSLGWWLNRYGHQPVLVERSPSVRSEGYMIDFFGPGYDVAERMGLIPQLAEAHYQIPFLAFLDAAGQERFAVGYSTLRKLLRDRHFNFLRGDVEGVLYEAVKDAADIRFGASLENLVSVDGRVQATLTDGSEEEFDLLVGADGVHSFVRQLAFGPEQQFSRFLGYYTAAFILPEAPERLSQERFYTLTLLNRQVAVYPIRGGRLAVFFIHRADTQLPEMSSGIARRELRRAFGHLDWIVPQLLDLSEDVDVYFDAVSQIVMPTWHRDRLALVGDACGCVSLLAGQGAPLAVAGGYTLATALDECQDVAGALQLYERRMRPIVERKQRAGRRFAQWFVPDNRLRLGLRDMGFRLVGWPPVGKLAQWRFALGGTIKI